MEKANLAGKQFITSSKLLESMAVCPNPSRAEMSDVSNAVLDGTTYVMLATKTANGNHLFESLDLLCKYCLEAEKMMEFKVMHIREDTVEEIVKDPKRAEFEA